MRLFISFDEAQNEIARDLAELGETVQPETMQAIDVHDNPDYLTKELVNYGYSVTKPNFTEIEGVHEEWVKQEWEDRLIGDLNPGRAWKKRPEIWRNLMTQPPGRGPGAGHFSYTYSRRMGGKYLQGIIDELAIHPHSRQLYLPVWTPTDSTRRGVQRVPCSLGYWFVQRSGKLNLTYMMRSCDFHTHYSNDVALAAIMQKYVSLKAGLKLGTFTHFVGSLHVYAKDVEDVF